MASIERRVCLAFRNLGNNTWLCDQYVLLSFQMCIIEDVNIDLISDAFGAELFDRVWFRQWCSIKNVLWRHENRVLNFILMDADDSNSWNILTRCRPKRRRRRPWHSVRHLIFRVADVLSGIRTLHWLHWCCLLNKHYTTHNFYFISLVSVYEYVDTEYNETNVTPHSQHDSISSRAQCLLDQVHFIYTMHVFLASLTQSSRAWEVKVRNYSPA